MIPRVEDLLKFQHEFNGEKHITFEVARMKNPDKYSRTHTAYVNVLEKTSEKPAREKSAEKPG